MSYWTHKAYGKEKPSEIALILKREANDVLKMTLGMENDFSNFDVYEIELRNALGDVQAMTQLICLLANVDFSDVYMTGMQKFIERCKERINERKMPTL